MEPPQVGILELDADGGLRGASPSARALLPELDAQGLPAELTRAIGDLLGGPDGPTAPEQAEVLLPRRPGQGQHLVVSIERLPSGTVVAVVSDATWLRQLAHDLGNVLTRVSGFAELAQRRLAPDDPAREDLAVVASSADEAMHVARGLAEPLPPS